MDKTIHKDSYLELLKKLNSIIDKANERIISETPDIFFQENVNFFSKSFLVIMCAYLESYLKDALMVIIDACNSKLGSNPIPYNLIKWSLNIEKDLKENELKFEYFKISVKKKELDDFISGNPFRTKDLFKKLGIDIERNAIFNSQKERINSIVVKRNKIIHHNDDASDVSNSDLKENIVALTEYINNIDLVICQNI